MSEHLNQYDNVLDDNVPARRTYYPFHLGDDAAAAVRRERAQRAARKRQEYLARRTVSGGELTESEREEAYHTLGGDALDRVPTDQELEDAFYELHHDDSPEPGFFVAERAIPLDGGPAVTQTRVGKNPEESQ